MDKVKILRLSTGEDVIAKVGENDQGVSLKTFVIIPQQSALDNMTIDDVTVQCVWQKRYCHCR
ncbi:MAG: hypothetical protein CM15mV25_1100 [uncultured marine virus]|nr:MAG: hypothetical protein CM15mV25_1100 [uncultured marine virus]